ncbi:hypothetical protein Tco_0636095 [Tanacetum coccineum]
MMRQNKNLMDINIDALYNILKQNQCDVNEAMGHKKKAVVVTLDPLALVEEKITVSKSKEKVVVQSDSEGSDDEDINDLKNITVLLAKAFNWNKYYAKSTNNNLKTSSASSSANKKPYAIIARRKDFAKDYKKAKFKDYNYYKKKMLLAKKDSDEQVLLVVDQAWIESSSDSDQEINANMVFMAKMEKVLLDSEESLSSAEETIVKVSYYSSDSESEFEYETSEYYDNSTNYGLFMDNDDDQEIYHDAVESTSEKFNENHIVSQKDHDESKVDHNDSEEKGHLVDKLIKKCDSHHNRSVTNSEESSSSAEETIDKVSYYTSDSESESEYETSEYYDNSTNYGLFVNNDDDQEIFHDAIESAIDKLIKKFNQKIAFTVRKRIEKANNKQDLENQNKDLQDKYDVLKNQVNTFEEKNNEFNEQIKVLNKTNVDLLTQTEVLQEQLKINFSDDYFQEIINPDFEKIDSPFQQTSSLKPYVPTVILEKIIIDLEDEVLSLLEKEKENLEIIESLKSKGFESSENTISELENQSENDCQVVEKGCDNLENSKVIASGMFKINVSQSISPISVSKTPCASNNVENKTKRKRRKRTSSKQNDKQVNNDVLCANRDFVHFPDLDTLSSVRRPKHSDVIWKKKGSSNTIRVHIILYILCSRPIGPSP